MRVIWASLVFVLATGQGLSACSWGDADRAENPRGRGQRRESALAERAVASSDGKPAKPSDPFPSPQAAEPKGSNPVAAAQEAVAAPEEEEKRDLGKELLAAVGSPTNCLRSRTGSDAPQSISIALEAVVVESGMVTRAYARSSALDAEEAECVRKRVAALSLRGPIEEAPRTVTATLEFKQKPAGKPGSP
jgi:hypothetical protein